MKFRAVVVSGFAALALSTAALADGPAVPAEGGAPASNGAPTSSAPSPFAQIIPFALMFGVIYFLMIRPQQKRAKEQQTMLSALKSGDEVLTASGMLGKVTDVNEKVVTLEIASNVRVKMLKTQVSQVVSGDQVKDLRA